MNITPPETVDKTGPVRNKQNRTSGPYNRKERPPPKGDIDSPWEHDMFLGGGSQKSSLVERLSDEQKPPKVNMSAAARALEKASGNGGVSIKGASVRGNLIEIKGLVGGTTADDVEAIFKRCGPIVKSYVQSPGPTDGSVVVRLVFKEEKDALSAVRKFNGETADGRTLVVKSVGGQPVNLAARLDLGPAKDGSVDALLTPSSTSKLRSDDIIAQDSRAQVLLAPPGTNPKDYVQQPIRGGRNGRGRGRGRSKRGGQGGSLASRMDID
jgi:RNA recognition motif-containing protein